MKILFALIVLTISGSQQLIAGERSAQRVRNWQQMRALAFLLKMLPPAERNGHIEEIAANMNPYEAIANQIIFSQEVAAKIRDEFNKNPQKSIKIQVDDSGDDVEWTSQEVREFLAASDGVRNDAPELIEEMARHGMKRLDISYEEGRRAFRSHVNIRINGNPVFPKSYTGAYIVLGIGAAAIAYELYAYFTKKADTKAQEAPEGEPA